MLIYNLKTYINSVFCFLAFSAAFLWKLMQAYTLVSTLFGFAFTSI